MDDSNTSTPWWKTRSGAAALGFLAVIGFFLAVEHRAHLLGLLPLLLLLACPLMHIFHHGRHGHHHGHGQNEPDKRTQP